MKWKMGFFILFECHEPKSLMGILKFKKKGKWNQCLEKDKFTLVSSVWDTLIKNNQNCYKPVANITVDEQLFPTKARCRFSQYMPGKINLAQTFGWHLM